MGNVVRLATMGALLSACVPGITTRYVPESSSEVETHSICGLKNTILTVAVTDGVKVRIQTAASDRVDVDALYLEVQGQETVRVIGQSITAVGDDPAQSISMKLRPFVPSGGGTALDWELRGPGAFTSFVEVPPKTKRPEIIKLSLPTFEVNGEMISVPPITYRLKREAALIGLCQDG